MKTLKVAKFLGGFVLFSAWVSGLSLAPVFMLLGIHSMLFGIYFAVTCLFTGFICIWFEICSSDYTDDYYGN